VAVDEIGWVEEGEGARLKMDGRMSDFEPRFRESAYTPIKKVVGQEAQRNVEKMIKLVDLAAEKAVEKKQHFMRKIRKS